jgi:hypothetical protein
MTSDRETGRENDWVRSRTDFARFVDELLLDFHNHPEQWQNTTLEAFLSALAVRTETIPTWYKT